MKKLMIVAAAAMGLAAFGDIESANTVGYVENALEGFKMLTPSFKNITGENYPIDNFMVKNSLDTMTSIQILDAEGQVSGSYYWYNEFVDGDTVYPAGWFDFDGLVPANIELKPGEAALFYTNEKGVNVLSAGEVPGAITHDVTGFAMLGNGSPVAIDVDTMTVVGSLDTMTSIQVLDAEGQVSGSYYWYNEFVDGDTVYPAGWFDFDGLIPAGIQLGAGESVLFYTNESGVKTTVPAAIAE